MKKPLHIVCLLLSSLFLFSYAQRTSPGPMDEVISALKSGNANLLSKYFDQTVELSLPDRSDAYSKTQAELVLKDFFQTKGVRNFDVDHQSDNRGSTFCIGTLSTRSGSYRTTVHMKRRADNKVILQEVRIEEKR